MVRIISAATILAGSIFSVHAFWRLECEGSTGLARIDPLMNFGSAGDHVHSIKGGSAFSPTSSSDDLLNSKCTSCGVEEDKSAYWTPALYFQHDDGTVEVVPEKPPHKSYYLLYTGLTHDGKQQKLEPFPNGFQMLAGKTYNRNSSLPNPDPSPLGPWPNESQDLRAQRAIGFNCLHYAASNDERTLSRNSMPDKAFLDANCADGIRLELQFPSCWNGQNDGGPQHNSHVAYPDGVLTGNCPQGYDRRLVSLFYETIVATDQFESKSGTFVFANGDPTGYGYHGDFIAAWTGNTLQQAVNTCTAESGEMTACPAFTMTKNSESCKLQSPLPSAIANEDVKGPMKGLTNGMGVYPGPDPAPKTSAGKSQSAPASSSSKADNAQNAVPTAALPSVSAPIATYSAEPMIGQIHEKDAVAQSSSSSAASSTVSSFSSVAPTPPIAANEKVAVHQFSSSAAAPSPAKTQPAAPAAPAAKELNAVASSNAPSTTPAPTEQPQSPGEKFHTSTDLTANRVVVIDEFDVAGPMVTEYVTEPAPVQKAKRMGHEIAHGRLGVRHSHHRHGGLGRRR